MMKDVFGVKDLFSVKNLAKMAIMAAVMCILAPVSIPIGTVPISLATLVVLISAYTIGPVKGSLSTAVYILLGVVGLPVFAGYTAGAEKLLGPTGGYMVGYLFMVFISGLVINKWPDKWYLHAIGMVLGTAACYVFGTVWFLAVLDGYTLASAMAVCVIPFIPFDLVKIVIAVILGLPIRKALVKARLY